jgi:hypothetical protein
MTRDLIEIFSRAALLWTIMGALLLVASAVW